MFSRLTKSVVKNLAQRRCYAGEDNLKMSLFDVTRTEVTKSLPECVKNVTKAEPTLIRPTVKRSSRFLMLASDKSKSASTESSSRSIPRIVNFSQNSMKNRVIAHFPNRELDLERTLIESRAKELENSAANNKGDKTKSSAKRSMTTFPLSKARATGLMGVLSRMPALAQDSTASRSRQLDHTPSEKSPYAPLTEKQLRPLETGMPSYREPEIEESIEVWLGDSDCGEGLPDRPTKGPYHPPDGPCVPIKKPGYPRKPRSAKKDFCFECPPKKPCNMNKCPPDADGTCGGKAIDQPADLLKLHSESQAVIGSVLRTNLASPTTRLQGFIWNGNLHRTVQANDHCKLPHRRFSDSHDSRKPPTKPPDCEKPTSDSSKSGTTPSTKSMVERQPECGKTVKEASTASPKCEESPKKTKTAEAPPKVLYRKCPPPPKLPKLPKCPEPPKVKAAESPVKIITPKCPPLPSLPKCPECPSCESKEKSPSGSPCGKDGGKDEKSSSAAPCGKDKKSSAASPCGKDARKEEKKGLWARLRECTKRKMSTYVRDSFDCDKSFSRPQHHKRLLTTSSMVTGSFSSDSGSRPPVPPWKPNKCKTIEEVCGEKFDKKLKALECDQPQCPRDANAECYPERPRCAEVRLPDGATAKSSTSKRSSGPCREKTDGRPVAPKSTEKIDYTKIKCRPSKMMKLGPCPVPPPSPVARKATQATTAKKATIPLPKAPSAPVVLCPCTPPPRLHPGSCPCYVEPENIERKPRTEPCPAKSRACPEVRIYYCKPTKTNACEEDDCSSKKNRKQRKPEGR